MKKVLFLFLCLSFVLPLMFYSCASDVDSYDPDEVVIVRDTLYIKQDSVVKEQREMQRVRLKLVVQLGAFNSKNHADDFANTVNDKLKITVDVRKSGSLYLVTAGSFTDASKAEDYMKYFKSKGYDNAFVKNIEY